MTTRNTIIPMIALSLAAALAGAGCMAQEGSADDESAREPEVAQTASTTASENTAESSQAFVTFNPFDHILLGHFFFDRAPFFGPFGFLGAACSCSGFGGCW
jgi:hypothetical protein